MSATDELKDTLWSQVGAEPPACDSPVHKFEGHDPIPAAQWVIFWISPLPCGIKAIPISLQCQDCYEEVVSGNPFECGPLATAHTHRYSAIVRKVEPL